MPRIEIPFCGPKEESQSLILSPQECINLYPRYYKKALEESGIALFGTPGLEPWVTPGLALEVRGLLVSGSFLYAVVGVDFYRVDTDGNVTEVATGVFSGSGPVGMATNGLDIVIVDGANGFYYTIDTGVLEQIIDGDFPVCDVVVHVDGYYLVNRAGTGQVFRSDYVDGSSWGGLAFSTAGVNPDNVVSLLVDHNDVYVIGDKTTEIWYNTGAATFNFARIPGAFMELGSTATFARCKANNAVYVLGESERGGGQVFQILGRQPKVVSTEEITRIIEGYDLSDAVMFPYQQDGHSHIVITFPTSDKTLVYDSTVGLWHERSSRMAGLDKRWRANTHAYFNGDHIVGDYANGKLYKMKTDVYTDNDAEMIAIRTAPVIRSMQRRTTVDEIQIFNEPGVGTIGGNAEDIDPQAIFSWSTDGGRRWSNEHDLPLGKIGEYSHRANWHQLGQGRNWVFRYKVSAAVKRVILGAFIEYEVDDYPEVLR